MQSSGNKLWKWIEKIIYSILRGCSILLKKEISEDIFLTVMQFLKFGIVGVSNTVISYVIYVIGLIVFQKLNVLQNVDYLAAQLVAFAISVLWSFYWNNKVVFVLEDGKERSIWRALLKTYISYSFTGLFLNSMLLIVWVQVFHMSEFLAPIINLLISVPLNFLINKFWAFRTTEQ